MVSKTKLELKIADLQATSKIQEKKISDATKTPLIDAICQKCIVSKKSFKVSLSKSEVERTKITTVNASLESKLLQVSDLLTAKETDLQLKVSELASMTQSESKKELVITELQESLGRSESAIKVLQSANCMMEKKISEASNTPLIDAFCRKCSVLETNYNVMLSKAEVERTKITTVNTALESDVLNLSN